MNIDVEIDLGDAALRRQMRAAGLPRAFARASITNIGEPEAFPLRHAAAVALAAELPREHHLVAGPAVADDVRAELAHLATIGASHLLLGENGVAEEGVGGGAHCGLPIILDSSVIRSYRNLWMRSGKPMRLGCSVVAGLVPTIHVFVRDWSASRRCPGRARVRRL